MSDRLKRALDVTGALIGLVVTAPLWPVIALAIRLESDGPMLFRQKRPGRDGRPFTLYKFRTMRDRIDERGTPLADEERITAVGRLLRRTSLDELPEFWNVLRGDMSLVGPRPLLMEYLPLYSSEQSRRHEVRPGITGWAQIHGRNGIAWEQRLRMDVWYVDHRSIALDVRILVRTFGEVVRMEGIGQEGRETMEKFRGSGA